MGQTRVEEKGRPSLPPPDLAAEQARWLAGARARLLRRAGIAHRRRVLDLGAGWGTVTDELRRRCDGVVVALDKERRVAEYWSRRRSGGLPTLGDARALPYRAETFDLIVAQNAFLWMRPLEHVVRHVVRVLGPGGAVVWLEPDYGGLLEHPPGVAVRDLWLRGLRRAGADPFVGRKLAPMLEAAGLAVRTETPPRIDPPSLLRFDLLEGLPLTVRERRRLCERRRQAVNCRYSFVHLPYLLGLATKP